MASPLVVVVEELDEVFNQAAKTGSISKAR